MAQFFFVPCIVIAGLFVLLLRYVFVRIGKEVSLYRMFSKNDELRALMAKDAKRFHISIVYLMTYMTRSDSDRIQFDKLDMIVKYVRDVCPQEYQEDAMNALEYLTHREKGSGKNKKSRSVIDVEAFKRGGYCFLGDDEDGFHYKHDLHGTKLAEELGCYLTEDDRLYVMNLLFRLAAADNTITVKGKKSEANLLYKLCVKGLKIKKEEFQGQLDAFAQGTVNNWYSSHFADKADKYPSVDVFADIFRCESCSFAFSEKKVIVTSCLKSVSSALFICVVVFSAFGLVFFSLVEDLMCKFIHPDYAIGFLVFWILSFIIVHYIPVPESSMLPVLRTKEENSVQLRGIIASLTVALPMVFALYFLLTNTLFLVANRLFSTDTVEVVTPVKEVFTTTGGGKHKKTYYHVRFAPVSVFDKKTDKKPKQLTAPNAICLEALRHLSGRSIWKVENTETLTDVKVSYYDYSNAIGKDVKLYFRVGYYGAIYYDTYSLGNYSQNSNKLWYEEETEEGDSAGF